LARGNDYAPVGGNFNSDGFVGIDDVTGFVQALLEGTDLTADMTLDGLVNGDDIQPFVQAILQ